MEHLDDSWEEETNRIPEFEPLPFIDYDLTQSTVNLLGSTNLDTWAAESHALLIKARQSYYIAHERFQWSYNGLQDVKTYNKMLKEKLADMGDDDGSKDAKPRAEVNWIKGCLEKNEKEVEKCLEQVRKRWLKQQFVTSEFGRVKAEFVEKVMPKIIEAGGKIYLESWSGM